MIIIRYFFMELKRTAVVMRRSIFRILIGLFLLCGAVMLIAATQQNQHTFQKLKVAIVLPDQNEITDMAVNLISTMDSIKSVCSFSYCTKEEAVSGIEQGNYQAAMLLTKDMYQDINSGINTPARILFAESDATEMIVFRELLRDGVWMLRTCESGVYAYLAYLYYNQVPTINDIGTLLAQRYMTVIFDRETLFESHLVSPIGDMTETEYYFLAAFLIVLLFMGFKFSCMYRQEEHAFYQEMKTRGLTGPMIGMMKVLVMTILLWFGAGVLYLGGCIFSQMTEAYFLWFEWGVLLKLIPFCMSMAAFFHLLYEMVGNHTEGTVFLLLIELLMVLCSGIIIPISYFPEIVEKTALVNPIYYWQEILQKSLYHYGTNSAVMICLAATLVLLCIGAFLSWKNV